MLRNHSLDRHLEIFGMLDCNVILCCYFDLICGVNGVLGIMLLSCSLYSFSSMAVSIVDRP